MGATFSPSLTRAQRLQAVDYAKLVPTTAPELQVANIRRDDPNQSNESCFPLHPDGQADPQQSLWTCPEPEVWVSNAYNRVQGCCSSNNIHGCTIPKTCFAYDWVTSCTSNCYENDGFATRCNSVHPSCRKVVYGYYSSPRSFLTEYACDSYGGVYASIQESLSTNGTLTVYAWSELINYSPTVIASSVFSKTLDITSSTTQSSIPRNKNLSLKDTRIILGSAIGGIAALASICLSVWYILYRIKKTKKKKTKLLPALEQSKSTLQEAIEKNADHLRHEAPGVSLPFEAPYSGSIPVEAPGGPLPVEVPAISAPVEVPDFLSAEVPSIRSPVEAPSNPDTARIFGQHIRRYSV